MAETEIPGGGGRLRCTAQCGGWCGACGVDHRVVCSGTYLSTEVEVAEEDGGLGAGDDEDDEDQEEESKHVIHLMGPASHTAFMQVSKP